MVLVGDFSLSTDSVHIYVLAQNNHGCLLAPSRTVLNAQEIQRADNYLSDTARKKFLHRRGMLRQLFSLYNHQPPQSIVFASGEYGKLYVPNSPIFFNVSHSEEIAVIALSTQDIGVDIEAVRAFDDLDLVAKHHFSKPEQADLLSLSTQARIPAFYRCWTRKEAFIKLIGTGLHTPLDAFAVTLLEDDTPHIGFLDTALQTDCFIYSFELETQYIGAIATPHPISDLIIHDLR